MNPPKLLLKIREVGMKLTTDVTLLFLSAEDNGIFVHFLCRKYGQ